MKKILALLVGLIASVSAFGAEEVSAVSLSAFTNAVPASTTYTNTSSSDVVDIQAWKGVAMQVKATGAGASTANVTVTLARSLSTTRGTAPYLASTAEVETIRPLTFALALNGTTEVVAITNIANLDGISGLKVYSVQNGATNAISGLSIKFLRKRTD
jgi:hypothetical protein